MAGKIRLSGQAKEWLIQHRERQKKYTDELNYYLEDLPDDMDIELALRLRQKIRQKQRLERQLQKIQNTLSYTANIDLDELASSHKKPPRLNAVSITLLISTALYFDMTQMAFSYFDVTTAALGKYISKAIDAATAVLYWIPGVSIVAKSVEILQVVTNFFVHAAFSIILFLGSRIVFFIWWHHLGVSFKERFGAKVVKGLPGALKFIKFNSKIIKFFAKVLEVFSSWPGISIEVLIQIWITRKVDKALMLKQKIKEAEQDLEKYKMLAEAEKRGFV